MCWTQQKCIVSLQLNCISWQGNGPGNEGGNNKWGEWEKGQNLKHLLLTVSLNKLVDEYRYVDSQLARPEYIKHCSPSKADQRKD